MILLHRFIVVAECCFQNVQWIVRWPTCLLFIDKFCIYIHDYSVCKSNELFRLFCNQFNRTLRRIYPHIIQNGCIQFGATILIPTYFVWIFLVFYFCRTVGVFDDKQIGLSSFWQHFKYSEMSRSLLDKFSFLRPLVGEIIVQREIYVLNPD